MVIDPFGSCRTIGIRSYAVKRQTIVGLDRDPQAIARAEKTLKGKAEKVILENLDYRKLDEALEAFRADLASMKHETQYTRLFRS